MAKTKEDPLKLYTVQEVAKLLRVTDSTVRRWLKNGDLPRVKLGHVIRIRPGDLEKFIENAIGKEDEKDV